MIAIQPQNYDNAARLEEMRSELSRIEAQAQIPALSNHPALGDTFPVRLPASLALTPILAPTEGDFNGRAAIIDAVFSTKAPQAGDEMDSAHVIVAGDTLYIHGSRLPEQATVVLEARNNPLQGCCELDAYGWSTMKSVKLPPQLCEGDYRLTLVGNNGDVCANAVLLTVRAAYAPLYVSLFAGMECIQSSVSGGADHPYLLGVAVDTQGWNIVSGGAYPPMQAGQRIDASLMLGGRYNQAGQLLPVTEPGKCIFHIGIGSANNSAPEEASKLGNAYGEITRTPGASGPRKSARLWSRIAADRAFAGKMEGKPLASSIALNEHVKDILTEGEQDTLLGTVALQWTSDQGETARQSNGRKDVVEFMDVRCGAAHYRLEFHLRRVYKGSI